MFNRANKKALPIVIGSLLVVAILIAFSTMYGQTRGTVDTNTARTQEGPEAKPAEDSDTDRLVMVFPAGNVPRDLNLVEDKINDYLMKKINATLDIRTIDMGSWWDKTGLMFASGEQMDIIFTAGWMRFGDEIAKGRYLPLDELLDKYGSGIRKLLDPSILEASKVNGRLYGIVTNKEFASSKGLVLRQDLVGKYDIDLSRVKTLADFGPIFEKLKQNVPELAPLQARADRSPLTFMMQYGIFDMLGEGPGVLRREGQSTKVLNMAETPEFMAYAKLLFEWNRKGYLNADATTSKDNEYDAVKAGNAFAYAESLKPGFEIQASRDTGYPMVSVELTKPYTTTADTTSAMFAITRNAKHPEKSMMLLNLLYTDPYLLNLLDWGVEGIHYVKKSDNVIEYPPGIDAKTVGYNLNQPWMFGNQLNSYLWDNENPGLWEEYRSFNEQADKSKALGFVFNPERVKAEIAASLLVEKEFMPAFNTGAQDPEKIIPMYVSKLKAAGADKVVEEKQRQLDRWLANR
ncbi:ABC transporter substrate-binding protein [Paenibacillus sp. BK720]|uniref:ABC transporter substrate-binding protein n=1 Tax=Paenibacillus sp. BK720 TaxID=2587092 RepID=UPI00142149FE|nr:ABC transporter substrate-binding protein [Paenibacillus sp. BK720]NIK69737.1 putative aldouronate transport system substrate-binding protein [Paenibacillus sp. BK720]